MKEIFKDIPDKRQEKNTTSLKFKKDLIEFLGDEYKNKTCLEIGAHKGYSTRVLSFLFNKVISCEYNDDYRNFSKNLNKDRDNIEYNSMDVYNDPWNFDNIDVVFIDCDHEYSHVMNDIKNSINLAKNGQELLLIFDDYGLDNPWRGVKEAIDFWLKDPNFKLIKEIGEPKGSDCNPRVNLKEVEGVICKWTGSIESKNVVFIPNIDLGNGRNKSYHYSIKSWKNWSDKNNCEILVWEDLLLPVEEMKVTWQRYYLFDILESNDINYNQILMVDADTIIHPNCPNFFNETENKYCGVRVDGCYEWVMRSIRGFGDTLFDGMRINPWNYINGGFQIVNKNHIKFFDAMKEYYNTYSKQIIEAIENLQCGTDQTILNYMLHKEKVDVKYLPIRYNLQDLYRKNTIVIDKNYQSWMNDELYFLDVGWIYHFNSIPQNSMRRDANYWIERTYKELYS